MDWIPASEPPQIEPGTLKCVVVARRGKRDGKWHVFGAAYLHEYELSEYDDEEETGIRTGFHVDYRHDYFDQYFEGIDVEFWQPMPAPPVVHFITKG